ncbi:MAG: CinA family protein [Halobacteriaceae archaeon]
MHEFAGEPPIQETVVEVLADGGQTVAAAESFTGGLVGALLTEVPGSSDVFDRSLVTYTHRAKMAELAVDRADLETRGAVSERVAVQLARGVRDVADTTWGVATTGIAGPDAEGFDQPVGTAYVAVARDGSPPATRPTVDAAEYHFVGSRSQVKERGARQALSDLYARLDAEG